MTMTKVVEPTGRVVLLGASNATLGLSTIVETARMAWDQPLDIMGAIGHGRSYGAESTVLGRRLPGIMQCGLWNHLEQRSSLRTAALVMDIGNDLVYGHSVDQIISWLETCLQRLADVAEKLVVTRLPLESLFAAPMWKFRILSKLIFPGSRLDRDQLLAQAVELDERLVAFAGKYRAYVVSTEPDWYGGDPIHIRGTKRVIAWHKFLTPWANGRSLPLARPSLRRSITVHRASPLHWHLMGFQRGRSQPSAHLPDGSTLSLY